MAVLIQVIALSCASPSAGQDQARVEAKMKEASVLVPKWVEAGGDPSKVLPLGERAGAALKRGDAKEAESLLDQILAIVKNQEGSPSRVEAKMKEASTLVPKWVEAGGDPSRVLPLGERAGAALKRGDVKEAESLLDEILAIVKNQKSATQQRSGPERVRVKVYDSTGRAAPRLQLLPNMEGDAVTVGVFPLDIDYNPVPTNVEAPSDGVVTIAGSVPNPVLLHFFPKVPGFGQVKVYADNGGVGYALPASGTLEIDLPLEAARSRVAKTRALVRAHPEKTFRKETLDRLASAEKLLAGAGKGDSVVASNVYRALSDALWAGEMATLDAARKIVAERGHRDGFLFGCSTNELARLGAREKAMFTSLFNFATIPEFYMRGYEEVRGRPRPDGAEGTLRWLESQKITAKGHPLVYLIEPNIPGWLKGRDYRTLEDAMRTRTRREAARFKARVKVWDIINEAHQPNQQYTQKEIVELTRQVALAAKQADPSATRVVNVNWPTGDYVVIPKLRSFFDRGMVQSTYQYLKALEAAGVDYDAIGIQVYYPSLDMMEISRLLDRYARFGKPIHISEIGVSSAAGRDPRSYFKDNDFSALLGEWHGPWSEDVQADWVEQFYTIAYSKPAIAAISWWDFPDAFWPYGGLLRRDLTPKKSYYRLKDLLSSWGFSGASTPERARTLSPSRRP
jgi:GH35 family endo-1,4-beta-xylanase